MHEVPCEWIRKAHRDLRASKILLEEGLHDEAAFHAQQAAEKALKALITALGVKPPKTHSIERLLSILEDKLDVSWAYEEDLPALTYYAVEARYPGPPVHAEEAEETLRLARKTVQWAQEHLRRLGIECPGDTG